MLEAASSSQLSLQLDTETELENEFDEDKFILESEIENILPYSTLKYYEKDFWDQRYEKDCSTFEWYFPYYKMKSYVSKFVQGRDFALDIGCGTSSLASDLSYEGFKKIYGLDFSSNAISSMKERYSSNTDITWIVANCVAIKSEKKFDAIFDKGTMDCLLSSGDQRLALRELFEISQILKVGGCFFLVSSGFPKTRTYMFKDPVLKLSLIHTKKFEIDIGNNQTAFFFLYVLQKI